MAGIFGCPSLRPGLATQDFGAGAMAGGGVGAGVAKWGRGLMGTGRGWWVPRKLREPLGICVLDVGGGGQQAGPSGFRESIPRTSHRWVQA